MRSKDSMYLANDPSRDLPKLVIILLILALLTCSPMTNWGQPVQAIPTLAQPTLTPTPTATFLFLDPSEEIEPGFLIALGLIVLAFVLILIGVGIVLGILLLILIAVFVMLGIISSSSLISLWQRRFEPGITALVIQIGAAIGVPSGIVAFWFLAWLLGLYLDMKTILMVGAFGGFLGGIAIGASFIGISKRIYYWGVRRTK